MKRGRLWSALAALLLSLAFFTGCGGRQEPQAQRSTVTVKVLDVGQGDAILIRTGEQVVLVDTSDTDETEKLRAALEKEAVRQIDKLIITHPHRDHLGGAAAVFQDCTVRAVYDNGQPATPKFYRNYLRTIKEKGIPYRPLRDGDQIELGGGAVFRVLSPTQAMVDEGGTKDGKINLNLNSVVARLEYGDFRMMFTGDAEKESEAGILERHAASELKSQVLKSGHHGSRTSSSAAFLKAVAPEAAVISCGDKNEYHHPHPSTRTSYRKNRIDYYRTDRNGAITIETDGRTYAVQTERGEKNDDSGN